MDEPVSQQEKPSEQTNSPADVWEQLDPSTRARVIELFAHSAYSFVIAHLEAAIEEDTDVH